MSTEKSKENQVQEIDLLELIFAIKKKTFSIFFTGFIFAIISFGITCFFITPQYDSTTKIYVIAKENEHIITSNDLQTGSLLTKDYVEMVKSAPVMEKVINNLKLNYSKKDLSNMITVETPSDTRVIKITVRNEDPYLAKDIANAVREAANIQIKEVMNIDIINTVEKASFPTEKATPNVTKNTLFGFALGAILSIGIVIWLYLIDDTIKSVEDVERYLGLNVLAVIPLKKGTKKINKNRRQKMLGERNGRSKTRNR